jgi:hypothetical protein
MYENQRSTILAVDNLNGATVLDRTLRVDHVKNYKQPRTKGEDGEWKEREEQSLNAKPEIIGEYPILCSLMFLIRLCAAQTTPGQNPQLQQLPILIPTTLCATIC